MNTPFRILSALLLAMFMVSALTAQSTAPTPVVRATAVNQTAQFMVTNTPQSSPTAVGGPRQVRATAADGQRLAGEFYLVDPARPTVLLLHQLYTNRSSWGPLVEPLLGGGYNLLLVDLRGHGQTGGAINWVKARDLDIPAWLAWLSAEGGVRSGSVSMLGSSMGSVLALSGCAMHGDRCPTAIAISPGWDYYGISVAPAVQAPGDPRRYAVIYAENDRWPALGVPRMVEEAGPRLETLVYPRNAHGMNLLSAERDTALPFILNWLARYGG